MRKKKVYELDKKELDALYAELDLLTEEEQEKRLEQMTEAEVTHLCENYVPKPIIDWNSVSGTIH